MKNSIISAIILILILFSCDDNTSIDTEYGQIKGTVLSEINGQGLNAVQVETNPPTEAILTDFNGNFEINNVKAGNYYIFFSKKNYKKNQANIMVIQNKTSRANIVLYVDSSTTNVDNEETVLYLPFDGNSVDFSENKLVSEQFNIQFCEDHNNNPNSAVYFNGIDSYVKIKLDSKLNLGINYSISLWLKPELLGGKQDINGGIAVWGRWDEFGIGKSSYGMSHSIEGNLWFGTHDGQDMGTGVYATNVLTTGNWHHIVFVKTGKYGATYVNGIQVSSNSPLQHAQPTNYDLLIGKMNHDRSYYKGVIDEFYIFNKSLSYSEIQNLYYN